MSMIRKMVEDFTKLRAQSTMALIIWLYWSLLVLPRINHGSTMFFLAGEGIFITALTFVLLTEGGTQSLVAKLRAAGMGGLIITVSIVPCACGLLIALANWFGLLPPSFSFVQ